MAAPVNLQAVQAPTEQLAEIFERSVGEWLSHDDVVRVYTNLNQLHISNGRPQPFTTGLFLFSEDKYKDGLVWDDVQVVRRRNCNSRKLPGGDEVNITEACHTLAGGNTFERRTHHCRLRHPIMALVHYRQIVAAVVVEEDNGDDEQEEDTGSDSDDDQESEEEEEIEEQQEVLDENESEQSDESDDYINDPDYVESPDGESDGEVGKEQETQERNLARYVSPSRVFTDIPNPRDLLRSNLSRAQIKTVEATLKGRNLARYVSPSRVFMDILNPRDLLRSNLSRAQIKTVDESAGEAEMMSNRNERAPDGLVVDAHLSDGFFHLILIKDCSRPKYLWHLTELAKRGGEPLNFEFVEYHKTQGFTFTSFGEEESVWNLDGEIHLSAQVLRGLIPLFASGPEYTTLKERNMADLSTRCAMARYVSPSRDIQNPMGLLRSRVQITTVLNAATDLAAGKSS